MSGEWSCLSSLLDHDWKGHSYWWFFAWWECLHGENWTAIRAGFFSYIHRVSRLPHWSRSTPHPNWKNNWPDHVLINKRCQHKDAVTIRWTPTKEGSKIWVIWFHALRYKVLLWWFQIYCGMLTSRTTCWFWTRWLQELGQKIFLEGALKVLLGRTLLVQSLLWWCVQMMHYRVWGS